MAAFELSSSAAKRISLADSTSAFAEIILLSANLRSFAALDNDSCKSLLSWMSLMKISSIFITSGIHLLPTTPRTDRLVFLYLRRFIAAFRVSPGIWTAHRYFWGWRKWPQRWQCWSFELGSRRNVHWSHGNKLMRRCWLRRCPWWLCSESC